MSRRGRRRPPSSSGSGPAPMSDTTAGLLGQLADVGRDDVRGGWPRPVFSSSERELLEWSQELCTRRGLDVDVDANGVLWAWWNPAGLPLADAVVTGRHLGSVPGGGAFAGRRRLLDLRPWALAGHRARAGQPRRDDAARRPARPGRRRRPGRARGAGGGRGGLGRPGRRRAGAAGGRWGG